MTAVLLSLGIPATHAATPVRAAWVGSVETTNFWSYRKQVALDGNGDVATVGRTTIPGDGEPRFHTTKHRGTDGRMLWQRHAVPGEALSLCFDAQGNVIVTGLRVSLGPPRSTFMYTAKYRAGDGATIWEQQVQGSPNSENSGVAAVVDGRGDVIVTGWITRTGSNRDIYTIKHRGSDGGKLWEKFHNGTAHGYDTPRAMALDKNGDVLVTGQLDEGAQNDIYTAKYRNQDGSLLWERSYNGPGSGWDAAFAVAVDNHGDVIIAGGSTRDWPPDAYTAKYGGTNGAVIWEHLSQRPGHVVATSMAITEEGDVVVAGNSASNGTYRDWYTAKHRRTDGQLLWEREYNGSGNRDDMVVAIGMNSVGNIVATGQATETQPAQERIAVQTWRTVSYRSLDGVVLWENPGGSPGPTGTPAGLAIGSNGEVVIVGNRIVSAPVTSPAGYIAKYVQNRPPTAVSTNYPRPLAGTMGIRLNAADPDGDLLTLTVLTPPVHGTLSGSGANLTYAPSGPCSGWDSFTFKANDGLHDSAPATITITPLARDSDFDGLPDDLERGVGRYQAVLGSFTWREANADAERRGGHLATVLHLQEWEDLKSALGTNLLGRNLWLGGTDEGTEGSWRWITGEKWTFTHWRAGEPSNDSLGNGQGVPENHLIIWGKEPRSLDGDQAFWNDLPENGGVLSRDGYVLETGRWTDAADPDGDDDGLSDCEELSPKAGQPPTDPNEPDTDGDGLRDGDELKFFLTNPAERDTDADGLADGEEVLRFHTDPKETDSDGDGYSDGSEVGHGSDPAVASSLPGVLLHIARAGELEFETRAGRRYQIQTWNTTDAWVNVGSPIAGSGATVRHLINSRELAKGVFRVVLVSEPGP